MEHQSPLTIFIGPKVLKKKENINLTHKGLSKKGLYTSLPFAVIKTNDNFG